jgi:hypothetical protein
VKFLTEEETKWKGEKHYEDSKKILKSKKFSIPWRNIYAKRINSGKCVYTCKLLDPKDPEEFYNIGHTKNPKMAKEAIEDIAYRWREYCHADDIPLVVFYDNVVCHNFVETWRGVNKEKEVMERILSCGGKILPSTDKDDCDLGADIIAQFGDNMYYIQVKVTSFLFGPKQDCIDDRKKVFEQFIPNQLKKNNGKKIPFIWLFYDYDSKDWFFNPLTNNFRFDIEKVLDYKPNDKDDKCLLKKEYSDIFSNDENKRNYLVF